jgi:CRP/FNR family cyclic AMP-dependent transcriptional regulator
LTHGEETSVKPLAELLAQNLLFAALSAADRTELARRAVRREYRKGRLFALYGEMWPHLFLVETGTINAIKESSEGRSLIVTTLGPGEIFWGPTFFHDEVPMLVTLEAYEASTIHLWPRESLLPILLENSQVLWELSRLMVKRMQQASEIVEGLAFQPVAGRLARLLLGHFEEAADSYVARDLTLDEMAARIGTTREMVCRLLYRFSDEGLIRVTRTEFALTDKNGLTRLADQG